MFIARLPQDKLEKAIKITEEALNDSSNLISSLDIQSLVDFLLFYSQAVHLERIFMQHFWDFVNHFSQSISRTTRRKMPNWVKDDLKLWNRLLFIYNGLLFFDILYRITLQAYINACMYGLGRFYYTSTGT